MSNRNFIAFLFLFSLTSLFGQTRSDSLFQSSQNAKGKEKAELLYEIAGELLPAYPDSALGYLKESERILMSSSNDRLLASVYKRYGWVYNSLNEFEKSLNYSRQAFELFKSLNDHDRIGSTCLLLGNIYNRLGDYTRAYEFYIESIEAYKITENISRIAHLHNNLGTIAHETGDLDNAEDHYRESLMLYLESGQTKRTRKVLNNIGMLFHDKQEYDSALFYLNKVLETADDSSRYGNYLISTVRNNVALIYFDTEQYDEGLKCLYLALSKSLEINNTYNIISAYINLGSFHTFLGNYDSAAYYLDKGFPLADSCGYQTTELELLNERSQLCAAMKNYEEAYYWGCKADTLDDLLFNENMTEELANLRVSYEQELQRNEIERLKNERSNQTKLTYAYLISIIITSILIAIIAINLRAKRNAYKQLEDKNKQLTDAIQLLQQSEEQLTILNQSKDKIFSIVAHDLRNPVAAVSGFTELLHDNFDQLNTETQKEYLLQILQGTQRIHDLLENLLIWARSQMKAVNYEPVKFKVETLIEDSIKHAAANLENKKIAHRSEIAPGLEVFADQQMIVTVMRNLLMNAIKFSFPGGEIVIEAKREKDHCLISIKDQGIGIQKEIQEKLFARDSYFSTPGTSGESGSGLGLKISSEFIEMNKGKIGIRSEPGEGSEFYFTLPLSSWY